MPIAQLPGLPLHYVDEGQGQPLVLLHAFPFSSDMYRPQIQGLRSRCRVLAPDLPGFGRTPPSNEPSTMEALAHRVLQFLDTLKLDRVILGGVSMGGYVAMALLRLDAGRVSSLALMDTQATADDEAAKKGREEKAQGTEREGMSYLVKAMLPKLLGTTASPQLRAEVEAMMRTSSPQGAARAQRGMALRPDSREILARFGGPAVIVVGEQDELTPLHKAQQMKELISGARLVSVPGAGHLANLEAPEQVNEALSWLLVPPSQPGSWGGSANGGLVSHST